MAITFHINAASEIVHSVAHGTISYADITKHLKAKGTFNVLGYSELFDATDATFDLSVQDLHLIARDEHLATGAEKPGNVAVVTKSHFIQGLVRTYDALNGQKNRDIEVFTDLRDARTWLRRRHTLAAS